jgi:hypothetical protein
MLELQLTKSYKLIDLFVDQHNAGKKLCEQLRLPHYHGMKALVRLQKMTLASTQKLAIGDLSNNMLRPVRTHRKQLAKWFKCGEKSVYNYLKRMQAAGFIRKTFRGSNCRFTIDLNTDLLWLHDPTLTTSENVAVLLQNPLPHMRQSLPHTLPPSVTSQVTNEYNELSGLLPPDAPAATPAAPSDISTQQRSTTEQDTRSGYHPRSENPASKQQDTPAPSKKVPAKKVSPKTPPTKAPKTVAEVVNLLPAHHIGRVRALVDQVWTYSEEQFEEWYPGYIVPAEVQRGKAVLAEFFVYTNPKFWNAAAAQFMKRIDMVDGHLTLRRDSGLTAWLPIPSRYFDCRNAKGFAGTKAWYKTYLHQIEVAKKDKMVARCLTRRYKVMQEGTPAELEETMSQIRQYLEKKGGAKLYAHFTAKIYTQDTINLVPNS